MIKNSILLVLILVFIELSIFILSEHKNTKKYFKFLPAVFWIYFVPMVVASLGMIDSGNPVFKTCRVHLLPASLVLLLMVVDIRAVLRLGTKAVGMMFAGSVGIMVATPVVFFIFQRWVGSEVWSGFGALSASWMGGSANMIAVKEAIGTPDEVFLPMVIVDTIVPYAWVGILVGLSSLQPVFDRFVNADRSILEDLGRKISEYHNSQADFQRRWPMVFVIVVIAGLGSLVAQAVAKALPVIPGVISTYAWTIIVISLIGVGLSFTAVRNLECHGASRIGTVLLYFVLTTIGAQANLASLDTTLILIAAGFCMVLMHAGILLIVARLIRAPMFLAAVASQANLGGVASAPIIAEIYQPGLASVGLLMAILGNVTGTYLGILTAQMCRMLI